MAPLTKLLKWCKLKCRPDLYRLGFHASIVVRNLVYSHRRSRTSNINCKSLSNLRKVCAINSSESRGRPWRPPMDQNFFNFIGFSENIKILGRRPPPPRDWCPLLGEVLDPPLINSCARDLLFLLHYNGSVLTCSITKLPKFTESSTPIGHEI